MSAPVIDVQELFHSVQYTGSNGADVVAAIGNGVTLISDTDGTLVIELPNTDHNTIESGEWWLWTFGPPGLIHTDTATDDIYQARYARRPALVTALVTATGTASVGASTLPVTRDVDVTISPAMADAAYVPHVSLRGEPGVISGHGILSAAVIDAETVRVTVRSAALSLAGATVHVIAHELA